LRRGGESSRRPQNTQAATIDCKTHNIDTPEVREALDLLAPYCRPEWRITGFRDHLKLSEGFGPSGQGQQQNLRLNLAGIHANVRKLVARQIRRLDNLYRKNKNAAVNAELAAKRVEMVEKGEAGEMTFQAGSTSDIKSNV
jgi:hypothetical protein